MREIGKRGHQIGLVPGSQGLGIDVEKTKEVLSFWWHQTLSPHTICLPMVD
jgi:hypothetical protein